MQIKKKITCIEIPPSVKKEIAEELGCTVDTVYNALNLTLPRQGEQPDRIRKMAMDRGGVVTDKIKWIAVPDDTFIKQGIKQ